jgi:hypothetical protein
MNADLKRVRADDSSTPSSPAKRRAMSVSSNAPPSASEGEGGVEEWQAVVEVSLSTDLTFETPTWSPDRLYPLQSPIQSSLLPVSPATTDP